MADTPTTLLQEVAMVSRNARPYSLFVLALMTAATLRAAGKLDDGQLDPAWFGQDVEFHKSEALDYFWVKPGFSLQGKTIQITEWPDPVFLGPKGDVDSKDSARAFQLSGSMASWIRGSLSNALSDYAQVSKDSGDYELTGRFVDVNAGSKVAKWMVGFGAGAATATWDMKLVDKKTGELLAAIHHRAVSGTHMSDIDDKILKWLDRDFGPAMRQNLASYAGAKPARK